VEEVKITKGKQLLVEGRTPLIFFKALLNHLDLQDIDVQNFKSNVELRGFLQAFANRVEFKDIVEAYGIIRDAEKHPAAAAFSSICSSIRTAGHQAPEHIAAFTSFNPRIGVYILPNCLDAGMLETLCLESVITTNMRGCIEAYFNCADSAGIGTPTNQTKAHTRAFLATQEIDEAQVGRAAQKGLWNWEHRAFESLKAFLRAL